MSEFEGGGFRGKVVVNDLGGGIDGTSDANKASVADRDGAISIVDNAIITAAVIGKACLNNRTLG